LPTAEVTTTLPAAEVTTSLPAMEVTTPLPAPDYCARYGLTQRETEVLDCILSGQSIAEISEALFISQRTVKFHITNLLRKTGATSQRNCSCCCTKSRENKLNKEQQTKGAVALIRCNSPFAP
ncbi:MAG: hypothetical protein J6Z35_00730, partial [Lachnospiraceae bacterium]|nr:hypothetical protein [Lachnospiraceae bacterium]